MRASRFWRRRRAGVLPLLVVCMLLLLVMAALAVDIGLIVMTKTDLQKTADASAVAAVHQLSDAALCRATAQKYAEYNHPHQGNIVDDADVIRGHWDPRTATFTPSETSPNAVRVIVRRVAARGNFLPLTFARVLGISAADVTAEAIAVVYKGIGTRFLIDDEVIDTDEPWIDSLKSRYPGTPVEHFISDRNGDFFLDTYDYLPADDKRLLVRTGQVGDEGLHDIDANKGTGLPPYPFGFGTRPFTHTDFLNIDELRNDDSQAWREALFQTMKNTTNPATGKGYLDPLTGVGRFNVPSKYTPLPNPDFIHVSPVYKSDISALDGVGEPVRNGVNAQGDRRGLLAFKILAIQPDPRGGTYLPNMLIELIKPSSIDINQVGVVSSQKGRRLVR